VWELADIFEVNIAMKVHPGPDVNVCNGVRALSWAGEVLAVGEPIIEDGVEALSLLDVAVDGVGDLLVGSDKVAGLSLHGTDSTMSKEDPLQRLIILVRRRVEAEFALLIVVLCQVEQDGSGLEDFEAVATVVDERGDASVRINL